MTIIFNQQDTGRYADGVNSHVRVKLAELIGQIQSEDADPTLVNELLADPSDDYSEEDDALEILNSVTDTEHVYWTMIDGDPVLTDNDLVE